MCRHNHLTFFENFDTTIKQTEIFELKCVVHLCEVISIYIWIFSAIYNVIKVIMN